MPFFIDTVIFGVPQAFADPSVRWQSLKVQRRIIHISGRQYFKLSLICIDAKV